VTTTVSASGSRGTAGSAGVLGLSTRSSNGGSGGPSAGSVLGAATGAGSQTLPFTGFPLWIATLGGALLLIGGATLRRHGRATA
jgi:hypothetical protein